jgi:prepilin signal peptidase PulO-like enzyme (type II secretory pathway)
MPSYRIPSRERVMGALRIVLGKRKTVTSQRELKELLDREMSREDGYRVSGQRARRIAYDSGLVTMEIDTRESEEVRTPPRCPVCDHRMDRVKNMTVFGGTVTLGHRCRNCPYWTGLKRRIPTRYTFTRKPQ